jgi:hypothetical protein
MKVMMVSNGGLFKPHRIAEIVGAGLSSFVISIDPNRPEGQGPSGHAMRAGTNYLSNDITTDNRNRRWRDVMAQLGIRAQATFLLRRHGKVVGAVHLYAGQVGFFDNTVFHRIVPGGHFPLSDGEPRKFARPRASPVIRPFSE